MATFGQALRRARDQRGISLDEIARETRLSKRYLIALEEEAIAKLPGGAYNRAYLKSYAAFLGLDPEPLVRDYAAEDARRTQSEAEQLAAMNRALDRRGATAGGEANAGQSLIDRGRPAVGTIAAVALGLAVAGGAVWFGWSGFGSASTAADLTSDQASPAPRVAAFTQKPETLPPRSDPDPPPSVSAAAEPPAPASPAVADPPVTPTQVASAAIEALSDADRALSRITVAGSGVGTAIVDRQLIGQADRFSVGSRVVFWTHVRGGQAGDTIDHVWFRDGRLVGAASLAVGSPDWRTQSRRRLDPSGVWAVEARDAEGHVLARHEFRASED